jgi:deoxycitidine kinase/deoxyguanosine kinase
MKIYSIEGNIGAGKSTLLLELSTRLPPGWLYLEEPVDKWETFRDEQGRSMLTKFYANPREYAFAFQIMAYTTRLQALKALMAQNPVGIVCERSLAADHHVFAKMLRDDGCLEPVLYDIYVAQTTDAPELDGIIYLDVNVDTCYERIQKRGRTGEEGVEREYLQKCESYYASWLTTTHIPTVSMQECSVEKIISILAS